MFEGKPPRQGDARALGSEGGEGEFLRELTWADLVARLQLSRGRIGQAPDDVEASFDSGNAGRIVADLNGKRPVNLEDSGIGKVGQGTPGDGIIKGAGDGVVPGLRGSK